MEWMAFSDISDFYSPHTDGTLPLIVANKNVSVHYQMYSGDKIVTTPALGSLYILILLLAEIPMLPCVP